MSPVTGICQQQLGATCPCPLFSPGCSPAPSCTQVLFRHQPGQPAGCHSDCLHPGPLEHPLECSSRRDQPCRACANEIAKPVHRPHLQDNISWAIGFGIPAMAMVLAIVLFVAGSSKYTHVEPTERCVCCCVMSPTPAVALSAGFGTLGRTRQPSGRSACRVAVKAICPGVCSNPASAVPPACYKAARK